MGAKKDMLSFLRLYFWYFPVIIVLRYVDINDLDYIQLKLYKRFCIRYMQLFGKNPDIEISCDFI